jgi:translation initiation factor 4E
MGDREQGKSDASTSFSSRSFSGSKRFGGDSSSHGRNNPFNSVTPLSTTGVASPGSTASSAFGLGSGAFASFGSATKTPKTPGTAFDFGRTRESSATPSEKKDQKDDDVKDRSVGAGDQKVKGNEGTDMELAKREAGAPSPAWPLKYTWVIWYRPPTSKNSDYEKSIKAVCKMRTAQEFWKVYAHLKRPSSLPVVSDYHFFKENIRPVWEDDENKKGGKYIMRLKKGVSDRYWEDLLLAMIGDQFAEAGEEVCGMVLSVRNGEDVFSIWTKNDGGRNVKIR